MWPDGGRPDACGLKDPDRLGGWGGQNDRFIGPVDAAEKICEKFWRESKGDGAMIHEGPNESTPVTSIRRS